MIFIQTNKYNIVEQIHYMPFDPKFGLGKSKDELEQIGYLVSEIPEMEGKNGYIGRYVYFNGVVEVEYIEDANSEFNNKLRIEQLEQQLAQVSEEKNILAETMNEILTVVIPSLMMEK